jgi:hypothetical protein
MRARFFFPGGLDPILDRGPGDKDAMVAPEVPTGGSVGESVLDDQADGGVLHAMGVATLGQRQVGHVGIEAASAMATDVLGVSDHDVDRPTGADVAQVVEGPLASIAP